MVWSFHAIGVDAERHAAVDGPLRTPGRPETETAKNQPAAILARRET